MTWRGVSLRSKKTLHSAEWPAPSSTAMTMNSATTDSNSFLRWVLHCIAYADTTYDIHYLIALNSMMWYFIVSYNLLLCLIMSYSIAPHLSVMWCNAYFLIWFVSFAFFFIKSDSRGKYDCENGRQGNTCLAGQ